MDAENQEKQLRRLASENERLRQRIDELEELKRKNKKNSVRYTLSKKAAYLIIGRGLKNALNRLYSELPDRVTRDTFADVSAHLIWRVTRVGLFGFMVGVVPLLILGIQTAILSQQNRLLHQQNELLVGQNGMFGQQVTQVQNQNELIQGQNKLFGEQNTLFESQNEKVDMQNLLVKGQNNMIETQNSLLDNQNELVERQNIRVEQQTELSEAARRSSLVFLMGNILDKVDAELNNPVNSDRTLSKQVVGRISALTQSLKPYRYLKDDRLIRRPLSPERGQLLLSLVNSNLDTETLKELFELAKFSRADLDEANLNDAYLYGARLTNAELEEAHMKNAVLAHARLKEARMDELDAKNADFSHAQMKEARLENADVREGNFAHAEMEEARLSNARLSEAIFTNTILKKADLSGADLRKADLRFADLKKSNLKRAKLDEAIVDQPGWLDSLTVWEVEGAEDVRQYYSLESIDKEGERKYLLKLKAVDTTPGEN